MGHQLKISLLGNTGTFTVMWINVHCPFKINKLKIKTKYFEPNIVKSVMHNHYIVLKKIDTLFHLFYLFFFSAKIFLSI